MSPPKLWKPPSARERWLQCEVPGCEAGPFPLSQRSQFDRHVKACLKRNGERIEAHAARRAETVLGGVGDPEFYEYVRRTAK